MDVLVEVVLPLSLAFIMFSLGVGLTWADFQRVGQRPMAFCIGAVHQLVLLPLVALGTVLIFGFTAEVAVGIMILAFCPGGVTSNVIAKLAKADVALSVSLTAVISLVSVLTVPVLLAATMAAFMGAEGADIDITQTALRLFALTVVPVLLGMGLRKLAPGSMIRAEPILGTLATILFALIVIAAVAANWELLQSELLLLGPALLCLIVVLSLVGFIVPTLLGRTTQEAKTISIETGIQNGTLGITVGILMVGDGNEINAYAVPSAVYGLLMYLTIIPALTIYRRLG